MHIPILHSPADMGGLAEPMAAAIIERLGRRHWEEYVALLDGFWKTVRVEIDALHLDYPQVELYQDGLPICGKEMDLVKKAAAAGSENHQLLLDLAGRGAHLMGTEDPLLLLQEYRDLKAALANPQGAAGSPPAAGQTAWRAELLSKRDAFIARRIDASLPAGRTGVLFLGMMHNVESFLPADIVSTRLVSHGPGQGSQGG